MGYDLHSFCRDCGAHRRRMPFGSYDTFWDGEPCSKCGSENYGKPLVARSDWRGRWFARSGDRITAESLEELDR